MSSSIHILTIGGFISISTCTLAPQTNAQELPVPTIRVSTRLVLIDAVVTDQHSQPILGLQAQDFTVQEKGKNQKIAFFTAPTQTSNQPVASALPPGTFTNRPGYSRSGPVTVVLLDAANTPFRDQSYGRLQMLKFVRDQYQAGQRMAIFTLTSKLGLLQDFTSDSQVLLKALQQYSPRQPMMTPALAPVPEVANSSSLQGIAPAAATAEILSFQAAEVAYFMDRRVETTLSAMRSLARMLGGLPGRKNIIWLTVGFPFSLSADDLGLSGMPEFSIGPISQPGRLTAPARPPGRPLGVQHDRYAEQVRDVAAQLASAQVAIYPVDVRGLESEASINSVASQMTMKEMAWESGGQAFVNQNDIHNGIARALQDSSVSYTIGYYPEDKNWDRRYRVIKVRVSRPGVEVRHRRGYFAIDPAQVRYRKRDEELAEALQDKMPDTLLIFDATVTRVDKTKARVEFLIDASSVSTENAPGGKRSMSVFTRRFSRLAEKCWRAKTRDSTTSFLRRNTDRCSNKV